MTLLTSKAESMPSMTIKNMPARLMERLRSKAEGEHRSVNRQVIAILEKALPESPSIGFKDSLEEYYEKWGSPRLTDQEIDSLRDRSQSRDAGLADPDALSD
ncbi:Arc family DNA-binding protein [Rhodothermus sp. AH-315-K08]|nr:Arc family DNA-binding protein [Rhodothermus sp. AH-315-K08]